MESSSGAGGAPIRRAFEALIVTLVVAAFSIMLGAALIGTLARYLIFLPTISWGEEVTRFAGIWSVFLVAGLSIRRGAHLSVDILTRLFPQPMKRAASFCVFALMLGFCLVLVCYGTLISYDNLGQFSPALQWRMGIVYLCVPIGGMLMSLEIAIVLVRILHGGEPPSPVEGLVE
jgi:TRAP-type C4-dicarboxylate transport system permease small subunit